MKQYYFRLNHVNLLYIALTPPQPIFFAVFFFVHFLNLNFQAILYFFILPLFFAGWSDGNQWRA